MSSSGKRASAEYMLRALHNSVMRLLRAKAGKKKIDRVLEKKIQGVCREYTDGMRR